MEYVHFELDAVALAAKYGKHKSCFQKSQAACGNGSYHAKLSMNKKQITCPKCIEIINKYHNICGA